MGRCARGIAVAAALWGSAGAALAGPDPGGALEALVSTPLRVAADAIGAAGLASAALVGLAGDGVSLLDANALTRPVLRGVASGAVRHVALAFSQGSTGALEGLRGEDIERLPEPRAAYLSNAPGIGRFDTFVTGLASARLALEDALGGPTESLLRLVGARGGADRVAAWQRDERIRVLGPLAPEPGGEAESATLPP